MPNAFSLSLPAGVRYFDEVISETEEQDLLGQWQATSAWETIRFRGQVARRRVLSFGATYRAIGRSLQPAPSFPPWLADLRARLGALAGEQPASSAQAIVSHYPPGAGIGWHIDAAVFGPVVLSLSLSSSCRFEMRRAGDKLVRRVLKPRSLLVLAGEARAQWQHRIAPVREDRYSLTLRSIVSRS